MSTTPTSNNAPSRKAAWKSNRPSWMRKGSLATHASHSVSSIVLPSSALTTLSYRTPADGVVVGQSPLATSSNTTSNAVPASASSGPQPNLALRHALETHIRSLPEVPYLIEVRELDKQQAQSSKVRPWTKRLTDFLNMIDRSIGGVAIAIQANPDVSSIVVGGAKMIIDIAIRFTEYLDALVEMLDKLSDYLPLLNKYAEHSHLPDICRALSGIYLDILNFYSTARKLYVDPNGQLKHFASLRLFLRAQYKPFSAEFGPIMTSIQYHYTVLSRSGVAELFSGQEELQVRLQEIQARQDEHRKKDFFGWLSAYTFELKQLEALEVCHQGTGRWLFNTHEFRAWADTDVSDLLWCHGKPGSGKSIIASQVVHFIQAEQAADPRNIGSCFAYYSANDTAFQGLRPLLLTLFKQLCEHQDRVPEWLLEAERHKKDPLSYATVDNFAKVASHHERIFIVIDGLDECQEGERRPVLELISTLRESKRVFKIFVTSRKHSDISRWFDRKGVLQVTTDAQHTTNDINLFIRQKAEALRQSQALLVRSDRLFEDLVSTLVQKADRMFLWVTLQLEHLCSLDTDTQIRAALTQIPEGLNGTYTRIVQDIDRKRPEQKALAIACFRWILSANRPLHYTEIQTALAFSRSKPPETKQEIYDDGFSLAYIIGVCGNLVHFPQKIGAPFWEGTTTFIHASVFQFFSTHLATLHSLSDSWSILLDSHAMHHRNALDCLNFLRLKLDSISEDIPLFEQVDHGSFNFYAVNHFDRHLVASGYLCKPSSEPLVVLHRMLNKDPEYLYNFFLMRLYLKSSMADGIRHVSRELTLTVIPDFIIWSTKLYKIYPRFPTTMSLSRLLRTLVKVKLIDAVNNLVREGLFRDGTNDIDETEDGDSALYIACEHGDTEMVDLLLHAGACPQPDPITPLCWIDVETPLFRAILEGHTSVVDSLLKAGIDVNVPTNLFSWYTYPLQLAEIHGHLDIAKLLIEHGADRRLFDKGKASVSVDEDHTVAGAERY